MVESGQFSSGKNSEEQNERDKNILILRHDRRRHAWPPRGSKNGETRQNSLQKPDRKYRNDSAEDINMTAVGVQRKAQVAWASRMVLGRQNDSLAVVADALFVQ